MITINDLNKKEQQLYRSYANANKVEVNQQKEIDNYLSQGKKGYALIINIVDLLKVNNESTAKIKVQVSRGMKKIGFDLTLQGLGKEDTVKIDKKNTTNQQKPKVGVIVKPKPITKEQAWDYVADRFTLDEVMKLVEVVKERTNKQGYDNLGKILTKALDKVD